MANEIGLISKEISIEGKGEFVGIRVIEDSSDRIQIQGIESKSGRKIRIGQEVAKRAIGGDPVEIARESGTADHGTTDRDQVAGLGSEEANGDLLETEQLREELEQLRVNVREYGEKLEELTRDRQRLQGELSQAKQDIAKHRVTNHGLIQQLKDHGIEPKIPPDYDEAPELGVEEREGSTWRLRVRGLIEKSSDAPLYLAAAFKNKKDEIIEEFKYEREDRVKKKTIIAGIGGLAIGAVVAYGLYKTGWIFSEDDRRSAEEGSRDYLTIDANQNGIPDVVDNQTTIIENQKTILANQEHILSVIDPNGPNVEGDAFTEVNDKLNGLEEDIGIEDSPDGDSLTEQHKELGDQQPGPNSGGSTGSESLGAGGSSASLEYYGDTISKDVKNRLTELQGYTPTHSQLIKATQAVLDMNSLNWNSARSLPVGFDYNMPKNLLEIANR